MSGVPVSGRLRDLADKATPGPWVACGDKRGGCQCGNVWSVPADVPVGGAITEQRLNEAGWHRNRKEQINDDARLIALAPELARWAADAADALRESHGWLANAPIMAPSQPWLDHIEALLACLAELAGEPE